MGQVGITYANLLQIAWFPPSEYKFCGSFGMDLVPSPPDYQTFVFLFRRPPLRCSKTRRLTRHCGSWWPYLLAQANVIQTIQEDFIAQHRPYV